MQRLLIEVWRGIEGFTKVLLEQFLASPGSTISPYFTFHPVCTMYIKGEKFNMFHLQGLMMLLDLTPTQILPNK